MNLMVTARTGKHAFFSFSPQCSVAFPRPRRQSKRLFRGVYVVKMKGGEVVIIPAELALTTPLMLQLSQNILCPFFGSETVFLPVRGVCVVDDSAVSYP